MSDRALNPIEKLVAKFSRAADSFETSAVQGMVKECSNLVEDGRTVYVLTISNGKNDHSFWLADQPENPHFYAPRHGDWVSGIVNTFDDSCAFAGRTYKPIFDFTNDTGDSERAAFEWFRKQDKGNTP